MDRGPPTSLLVFHITMLTGIAVVAVQQTQSAASLLCNSALRVTFTLFTKLGRRLSVYFIPIAKYDFMTRR